MSSELMTVEQVADRIGYSTKQTYRFLEQGAIPAGKVGKKWIVTTDAVESVAGPPGQASS